MDLKGLPGGQYKPLSDEGIRTVHEAALAILEKTGFTYESGLDDTLSEIAGTMRRFVEDKVAPNAHQWHRDNDGVPGEFGDPSESAGQPSGSPAPTPGTAQTGRRRRTTTCRSAPFRSSTPMP